MRYLLCRVEDDATTTLVSQHDDVFDGIAAGKRRVEQEDFNFAYSLHTDDGCKVGTLAGGRIGYREWARCSGRLDYTHPLDDKYDHNIDRFVRSKYRTIILRGGGPFLFRRGEQRFELYLVVGGLAQSIRNIGDSHVSVLSNCSLTQHASYVY